MRSRLRTPSGPRGAREGRPLELVRVRGTQRNAGYEGRNVGGKGRRRGGRGRGRFRGPSDRPPTPRGFSLWAWLKGLLPTAPSRRAPRPLSEQEARTLADFSRHFGITFEDAGLLKLALTHRSYLSVTGQGPRESNERLEFLGDSVLGLVTSEFLYRQHPDEHEGQLTKTKSLVVSKAILSRRALAMGLGRFVLMSHSEVESGGRQRLSILADAFEAVIGAIYLDQGFEASRTFIHQWLLKDTNAIASDERHANYKSHLQEYVQSTFHTHPVYRIRSEYGPDHSKHFMVDVLVGKRGLGSGKGRNKKEAEQAAARNALEQVGAMPTSSERAGREVHDTVTPEEREPRASRAERPAEPRADRPGRGDREAPAGSDDAGPVEREDEGAESDAGRPRRRGRRGGRGRRGRSEGGIAGIVPEPRETAMAPPPIETRRRESRPDFERPLEPGARPPRRAWLGGEDDELEEIGRPEGPLEERRVDPFDWETPVHPGDTPAATQAPIVPAVPSRGERQTRRIGAVPSIDSEESEPARYEEVDRPEAFAAEDVPTTRAEARDRDTAEEDESGPGSPAAGSLFSHDRPSPPTEEQGPRYGRRSRPRSRR